MTETEPRVFDPDLETLLAIAVAIRTVKAEELKAAIERIPERR